MKILFLSAWFPYPPDNGSKIRVYNLLRALGERHQVTLLTFAAAGEGNEVGALRPYCQVGGVVPAVPFRPTRARALLGFLSPTPRSVLDTYSREMAGLVDAHLLREPFHLVIASELGTAPYALRAPAVPRLVEDVEVGVIREAYTGAATGARRLRSGLTWAKHRRYIARLLPQFTACTVVSDAERGHLRELAPGYEAVHVVPNGVDLDWLQVGGAEPTADTLVFHGALTFHANRDAMAYFLGDIWPRVRSQRPQASLKITGRTDGVDLSSLPLGNGVTLTGYLPDVRPAVAVAWACVVPLRVGGGTRVKILEAMALGTPVVATSKGAEGLAVTSGDDILIADDPEEFAAQTSRLLGDPALRGRLSAAGRRLVEERYGWSAIGAQFTRLVESLTAVPRENQWSTQRVDIPV